MNRPLHVIWNTRVTEVEWALPQLTVFFFKKIFTSYKLLIWTIQDSEEGKGCGTLNFGYLVKTDKKLLLLFLAYTLSVIIFAYTSFPESRYLKNFACISFCEPPYLKNLACVYFWKFLHLSSITGIALI